MQVFKILTTAEWKAAEKSGVYDGSAADVRDGFIHLSTSGQLAGTLTRYFADATDLTLVSLDSNALGAALKWEPSRGGQSFPHLYDKIDPKHVLWTEAIKIKSPGVFALPVRAFVDQKELRGRTN